MLSDPASVVNAARLIYEDGAATRAVELLQLAIEHDPEPMATWLALFEIFRLERLRGEYASSRRRFMERFTARPSGARCGSWAASSIRATRSTRIPSRHSDFDPAARELAAARAGGGDAALAAELRGGLMAGAAVNEQRPRARPHAGAAQVRVVQRGLTWATTAPSPTSSASSRSRRVREASERSAFLAAIRELGRDGGDFTLERLQQLIRVEDHFQALLLYGQLDFLRQPFVVSEADRDFALNIQRICLEAANGFQRFLRNRASWARTREALDVMFLVTGLAVDAIHRFVKWGYFLNETGRGAPWKQMHALYALADADGYADAEFGLHASQPDLRARRCNRSTCGRCSPTCSTPATSRKVQIEIADGWFAAVEPRTTRSTAATTRASTSSAWTSRRDSGMHLVRRQSQGDTVRYLRAERLGAQIEAMRAELRQGRLHAGDGAGASFPIEEHAALLGHRREAQPVDRRRRAGAHRASAPRSRTARSTS